MSQPKKEHHLVKHLFLSLILLGAALGQASQSKASAPPARQPGEIQSILNQEESVVENMVSQKNIKRLKGFKAAEVTSQIQTSHLDASQATLLTTENTVYSFITTVGLGLTDHEISGIQIMDGGYVVVGNTRSFTTGSWDDYGDIFLIKFNRSGELVWARTAGGPETDGANSVTVTTDGGFIVAGYTESFGEGYKDILLLKFDSNGLLSWAKTAGGPYDDKANSVQQTIAGNYIVTGYTYNRYTSYTGSTEVILLGFSNSGLIWGSVIGGSEPDLAYSIEKTDDGGYIVAGKTESFGEGSEDVFLIKYDSDSKLQWAKSTGGSSFDEAQDVLQTGDGGYIVAGNTESFGAGNSDVFLLKYDSSGGLVWARTVGGSDEDEAYSVAQTADGGYIVTGATVSYGSGSSGTFPDSDLFLIKFDSSGTLSWATTMGGYGRSGSGKSVQQTGDGGYVVAGYSYTFEDDNGPLLLMKTDIDGSISNCTVCRLVAPLTTSPIPVTNSLVINTGHISQFQLGYPDLQTGSPSLEWSHHYGPSLFLTAAGGSGEEKANSIMPTLDGGFIVAGHTESYGAGKDDILLLKYDKFGTLAWTRTYGGSGYDQAYSVAQTSDNGFVLAGSTTSYGTGGYDALLLTLDENGSLIWARTAGGSSSDHARNVQQTTDGGYIVAGYTNSFGLGGYDALLLKYDSDGELTWARTTGGSSSDYFYSVDQTSDNGYMAAGWTYTYSRGSNDVYLVKFDSGGSPTWMTNVGGSASDYAYSVQQTSDGGYIATGGTTTYGTGNEDIFLLKLTSGGTLSWARTAGGSTKDYARSVMQTSDGGYILTGTTDGFGAIGSDVFLVKLTSAGEWDWTLMAGGSSDDEGWFGVPTEDGSYIVTGMTSSFGTGYRDVFLMKANTWGVIPGCDKCQNNIRPTVLSQNPSGNWSSVLSAGSPTVTKGSPTPLSNAIYPVNDQVCGGVHLIYLPVLVR